MEVTEITSVKLTEGGTGYLVNGTLSVPMATGNRHYAAVQEWIGLGNTPDPAFTLSEYKDKKKSEINTERDSRLASLTVDMGGNTYDADSAGRENLNGVIAALGSGISVSDPLNWRDSTNVTRSLTHVQLNDLAALMLTAVQTIYETSWTLKAQVDAAADEAAVDAVTWI